MTEHSEQIDTGGSRRTSQQLWPLFLVALSLMGVGFYLALTQEIEVDLGKGAELTLGRIEPLAIGDGAVDAQAQDIELAYAEGDARRVRVALRQRTRQRFSEADTEELATRVGLELTEVIEPVEPGRFEAEGALGITRTYEGAQAEVRSGSVQKVGPGITSQVEDLIRGSITRLSVTPNGEPLDFEWREVPNPQARRTLYLVRDAHSFLTPRFVHGAVNAGESWSYKRPIHVEEPELGLSAEGVVEIDNRLAGRAKVDGRRLAVIYQTLDASAEGELEDEEAGGEFRLDGTGQATIVFDLDQGRVYAADLSFERQLSVGGQDEPAAQTSEIFLALRPAESEGSALPELRQEEHQDGHELEAAKDHAEAE